MIVLIIILVFLIIFLILIGYIVYKNLVTEIDTNIDDDNEFNQLFHIADEIKKLEINDTEIKQQNDKDYYEELRIQK